jgi:hypothetical protein
MNPSSLAVERTLIRKSVGKYDSCIRAVLSKTLRRAAALFDLIRRGRFVV